MEILFKQAVCLNGVDYSKGVHDIPKEALATKYFQAMVKAGLAVPHDKTINAQSEAEKQKKMSEDLFAVTQKAQEDFAKAEKVAKIKAQAEEKLTKMAEEKLVEEQLAEEEDFFEAKPKKSEKKVDKKKKR